MRGGGRAWGLGYELCTPSVECRATYIYTCVYVMDSFSSLQWDEFFDQIQSVAAHVPYMVCIGNHERDYPDTK